MEACMQIPLDLRGGMFGIDGVLIPPEDVLNGFGDDEQKAIDYSIAHAMKTTGNTHAVLAAKTEMSTSQFSLLWSGQRGIPMRRMLTFIRGTGSAALLAFYAKRIHCVLKSEKEWRELQRRKDDDAQRIRELEAELAELKSKRDAA